MQPMPQWGYQGAGVYQAPNSAQWMPNMYQAPNAYQIPNMNGYYAQNMNAYQAHNINANQVPILNQAPNTNAPNGNPVLDDNMGGGFVEENWDFGDLNQV